MQVKALIKFLEQCDPTKPVRVHLGWGNEPEIESTVENPDHVLLGDDLPPERYENDYRYN